MARPHRQEPPVGHSALQRKLTLLASAREVKRIGGRDTIGQSSGADVVDGALKDLERTAWKLGLSHPNELEPFDSSSSQDTGGARAQTRILDRDLELVVHLSGFQLDRESVDCS